MRSYLRITVVKIKIQQKSSHHSKHQNSFAAVEKIKLFILVLSIYESRYELKLMVLCEQASLERSVKLCNQRFKIIKNQLFCQIFITAKHYFLFYKIFIVNAVAVF